MDGAAVASAIAASQHEVARRLAALSDVSFSNDFARRFTEAFPGP